MPAIALPIALIAGSAISGGAALASGAIGASASKSAANTQAAAGQQAADLATQAGQTANAKIGDVLSQQQSLLAPYSTAGTQGLDALSKAIAPGGSLTQQFQFDPSQIANNPNYQFQLQQGLQAVQRASAASGTLNGGGTLKALDQYSQGLASNEIAQSYQQALSTFNTNRNSAVQNIALPIQAGEYGTSGQQSALQNYGNLFSQNTIGTAQNVGNDLTQKANAQAAGTVGVANAYSGALGGLASSASSYALLSALTGAQQPTLATGTQVPATSTLPAGYSPAQLAPSYAAAPTAFPTANAPYNPATFGSPYAGGYLGGYQ